MSMADRGDREVIEAGIRTRYLIDEATKVLTDLHSNQLNLEDFLGHLENYSKIHFNEGEHNDDRA